MIEADIRQDEPGSDPMQKEKEAETLRLPFSLVILALAAVFLVALVPRILYVIQIQTPPFSDMADYHRCAVNFMLGDGLIQSPEYKAYRTPGYPIFLATIYSLFGIDFQVVYLVQCVLGALTAVLTALLFLKCFPGIRYRLLLATLAGLITALSDESIFYCGQLLTETLYTFLFVIWVLLLMHVQRGFRLTLLVIVGLLHGLLMLVRPAGSLHVIMVGVFLVLWARRKDSRRSVREGLISYIIYSAVVLVPIVPWGVRNYLLTGHLIPLSTNDGVNFYIGHNPDFGYWSTGNKTAIRENTDLDEYEESRLFFRLGLEFILKNPVQDMVNNIKKIGYLYTTTWKPWPWFNHGRELRFAFVRWMPVWEWSWPAMVVIGLGSVASTLKRQKTDLLLGCVITQTISCMVFFATARFRSSLIPLFAIWVAYAFFVLISTVRQRGNP